MQHTTLSAAVLAACAIALAAVVADSLAAQQASTEPPQLSITDTSPAASAIGFPSGEFIHVAFSRGIEEATPTTFALTGSLGGRIPCTPLGGGTSSLLMLPGRDYLAGELLEISVSGSLAALGGGLLARPKTWRFRSHSGQGVGSFAATPVIVGGISPQPSAALQTRCVAAFDADGDMDIDLLEGSVGNACVLWVNSGNGASYVPRPVAPQGPSNARAILAADLDGDGAMDLVVTHHSGLVSVWRGLTGMVYRPVAEAVAVSDARLVLAGDLDGDTRPDLVVVGTATTTVLIQSVALDTGIGTFVWTASHANQGAVAAALGDFNNDGALDLAETGLGLRLYQNVGHGLLGVPTVQLPSSYLTSVAVGDVNNDGRDDLLVAGPALASLPGATAVLVNAGETAFLPSGGALHNVAAEGVMLADLDGDGQLDAVTESYDGAYRRVWFNQGGGSFIESSTGFGAVVSGQSVLADVSGDGALDCVVPRLTGSLTIYPFKAHDRDVLVKPGSSVPPTLLASNSGQIVDLLSFSIQDGGSADGLPAVATKLIFSLTGSTMDAREVAWSINSIATGQKSGVLFGAPGNQHVVFDGLSLAVPSSGFIGVTLSASFPALPQLYRDRDVLRVTLPPNGCILSPAGSQLLASQSSVTNGGGLRYSVTATRIAITKQPPVVVARGVGFEIVAAYLDNLGNLDLDVNGDVVLAGRPGSGEFVGLSWPAVSGVAKFDGSRAVVLLIAPQPGVLLYLQDTAIGMANLVSQPILTNVITVTDASLDVLITEGAERESDVVPAVGGNTFNVLDFVVTDLGYGGGGFSFTAPSFDMAGSSADANDFYWVLHGPGVGVFGVVGGGIGTQKVSFPTVTLAGSSGASVRWQLLGAVRQKHLASPDNSVLHVAMGLGADTSHESHPVAGQAHVTNGAGCSLRVTATKLQFTKGIGASVSAGDPIEAEVAYTDEFGNVDVDVQNDVVTVRRSDSGTVHQGESLPAENGMARFTGNRRIVLGPQDADSVGPIVLAFEDDSSGDVVSEMPLLQSGLLTVEPHSRADVNMDGAVNIGDIQSLVNMVLGTVTPAAATIGDLNRDGLRNIADVQQLVGRVLAP